jgi:hypothetical protein
MYRPTRDGNGALWYGFRIQGVHKSQGALPAYVTAFRQRVDGSYYSAHGENTIGERAVTERLVTMLKEIGSKVYTVVLETIGLGGGSLLIYCPDLTEDLCAMRKLRGDDEWASAGVEWESLRNTHMVVTDVDQWNVEDAPVRWIWEHDAKGRTTDKARYPMVLGEMPTGFLDPVAIEGRREAARGAVRLLGERIAQREMVQLEEFRGRLDPEFYEQQVARIGKIATRFEEVTCCAMPNVCFQCDATVRKIISGGDGTAVRQPNGNLWLSPRCAVGHPRETTTTATTQAVTTTTTANIASKQDDKNKRSRASGNRRGGRPSAA